MDATVTKLLGTIMENEALADVLREMSNEAVLRANALPEHLRGKSRWWVAVRVLRTAAEEIEAQSKAPRA